MGGSKGWFYVSFLSEFDDFFVLIIRHFLWAYYRNPWGIFDGVTIFVYQNSISHANDESVHLEVLA